MIELGLKFTFAYLLGAVLGSLVVGFFRGGVDIRTLGSGNAGGTNALRTQGKAFAFWVMVIDVGKGILAVAVIPGIVLPGVPVDPEIERALVTYAVAFAAIVGHVFPVWFGFRGGKGAATLAGIFAVLLTGALGWMLLAFVLVIVLTGYVGLSTVTAAVTALLYSTCFSAQGLYSPPGLFTLTMTLLVVYTHRENLVRVWQGRESRFERAMVFKRWLGR